MLGKNANPVEPLKGIQKFLFTVIRPQHLVAKHMRYENVMKIILKIVNLIHSNAKTRSQFKHFLKQFGL
jgi:hypothetical protein